MYQEPGDLILTFPGAYHCGFSPNFNVCEAVNIACADWLPSAKKHLHMNAAEGHPRKSCFSLEWMVSENRRKIERLDFTKEAADSLDAFYREMVKEEIEARRGMRARTEEEGILSDKSLKFWDLLCVGCRQYCYLTCMGCDVCFKIWCVRCQVECQCENRKLKMFVRFTDSELVNC